VTALERPLGITVTDEDNLLAVKGVFVHALRLPRQAPAGCHCSRGGPEESERAAKFCVEMA
jgi:hypothetical protein